MSGFPTVNFSETQEGLFSPEEVRTLMRIEFDRSRRYGYPAAAMLIEIDRLEYLHDLYGWESKEEILRAVIRLLRSTTRDSDFLGCMHAGRILVVFPHTSEDAVTTIAARLLSVCRDLDFRTDGRSLRATLSIGIATVRPDSELNFDAFLREAEEAIGFAAESGGDRFVRREAASEVFRGLREELEDEARSLVEAGRRGAGALAPDPAAEGEVAERIAAVLRSYGVHAEGGREAELESALVRIAQESLRVAREAVVSHHRTHIDTLERRVAKLKNLLDTTEAELGRLAAMRGGDSGIASIYRTVQGLRGDEAAFEAKKEMLTLIFEANLELQKKSLPRP